MKFTFYSEKLKIGFNGHKLTYLIKDGELYHLPPKVIKGLLFFVLPNKKVISYNKLKKNFSHKDYICKLKPLPF